MATFKEILARAKQALKDNLNDTNLDLFTKLDKDLDELSVSHEQTEKDLSTTKDKLIEVVKSGSFKNDNSEEDPTNSNTDAPMNMDDAFAESLKEIEANRKE